MPALQLVHSLRATLGPKHATVANQVSIHFNPCLQKLTNTGQIIEFLAAHRDTFVIFLKSEMDNVTLAMMEEVHLLVTMCGSVLHHVPKVELVSRAYLSTVHRGRVDAVVYSRRRIRTLVACMLRSWLRRHGTSPVESGANAHIHRRMWRSLMRMRMLLVRCLFSSCSVVANTFAQATPR